MRCLRELKSWLGNAKASGALITTKGCSTAAWQALQPCVSRS